MRWQPFSRVLFVLYCIEAGAIFLLIPWSRVWDQGALHLPVGLQQIWVHPLLRGVVSGFGLLHLIWGAHDLDLLLTRRRKSEGPPGSG